jgi:hypothetical protein
MSDKPQDLPPVAARQLRKMRAGFALAMARRCDIFAEGALHEAARGNPAPLAGRLRSGVPLTQKEREYLADLVESSRSGHRGRVELRKIERKLIRLHVESLIEEGMTKTAAVAAVVQARGVSRAKVFDALKGDQETSPTKSILLGLVCSSDSPRAHPFQCVQAQSCAQWARAARSHAEKRPHDPFQTIARA